MADNYAERDFWEPIGRGGRKDRPDAYSRGGQKDTRAGGVILLVVSSISALLVILGFVYAMNSNERHLVAMRDGDCEPSLFISGLPCVTQTMLVGQYEAIVTPAVSQLNTDVAAYNAAERHNLVAAKAALTAELTTEQALDNNLAAATFTPQHEANANTLITDAESNNLPVPLAAVTFTPQMTVIADALIRDVQTVANLTAEQMRASSLAQMRSFNGRVDAATAAAQAKLHALRRAVVTPLPPAP